MEHEYVADTFTHQGLTVKIIQDTDAESPRDWDNVGTMVCWHSRYGLGDEQRRDNPDEWLQELASEHRPNLGEYLDNTLYTRMVTAAYNAPERKVQDRAYRDKCQSIINTELDKHYIILPLYLFDHSGISISTGSFNDPWDSGQVGWIYCSKERAVEEWGKKVCTRKVRDAAIACLKSEVEVYDQFLTGDVYGYVIETTPEEDEDGDAIGDGEHVDSCWGFFGLDYAKSEALDAAKSHIAHEARKVAESAGDVPMHV